MDNFGVQAIEFLKPDTFLTSAWRQKIHRRFCGKIDLFIACDLTIFHPRHTNSSFP